MAALTSHTTTPSPPTHANPAGACPLTLPCGTLLWLLSGEGSGFVTGQVIAVDGGFSAFSGV